MNEQPDPAHLILAKVLIGQLPRRATTRCWVGQGQGLPCDGCDRPVTPADLQHEVDAIGLGTLRFHARCMQLWEEASATPRDISGGSSPSASTLVFDLHVARRAARDADAYRELRAASVETWTLATNVRALSGRVRARSAELLVRAMHLRRAAATPEAQPRSGQSQPQVVPANNVLGVSGWRGRAAALAGTFWTRCAARFSRPPVRRPATGGSYAAVAVAVALTVATVWIARPISSVGIREPSAQDRTSTLREIPRSHVARSTPQARGAPPSLKAREARSARLAPRTPPPPVRVARVSSWRPTAAPPRILDASGHARASTISAREVVSQAP
jgi:hypothetical protein